MYSLYILSVYIQIYTQVSHENLMKKRSGEIDRATTASTIPHPGSTKHTPPIFPYSAICSCTPCFENTHRKYSRYCQNPEAVIERKGLTSGLFSSSTIQLCLSRKMPRSTCG